MHDDKTSTARPAPPADDAGKASRPPYEPPRLTRRRTVQRATLFSGGGGPGPTPLVGDG